jgi:hypothetical protein
MGLRTRAGDECVVFQKSPNPEQVRLEIKDLSKHNVFEKLSKEDLGNYIWTKAMEEEERSTSPGGSPLEVGVRKWLESLNESASRGEAAQRMEETLTNAVGHNNKSLSSSSWTSMDLGFLRGWTSFWPEKPPRKMPIWKIT